MLGKIEGRRRRGQREDEMIGWHHRHDGHEFEQTLGDGEGQGSLACCSLWGRKGSDMTEQRNNNIADGRSCQAHADWSRPKAARGDVYLHTVSATGLNFLRAGTTCDSPLHPQGTEAQCLAHNRCSVNAFGVDP